MIANELSCRIAVLALEMSQSNGAMSTLTLTERIRIKASVRLSSNRPEDGEVLFTIADMDAARELRDALSAFIEAEGK